MRRVLFVTNSLTGGGAERAMNLAANELFQRNWQVALVPINLGEPDYVQLKCQTFPLNRVWRGGIFPTLTAYVKFILVVKKWNPQIIVFTCDLPELFGAFLPFNKEIVIVEEAKFPWGTRKTFGKVVRGILALRRVSWVSASHHLRIWPTNNKPHTVIQNALTPFEERELPSEELGERIVYVGRLSPEKRPEWFVEIVNQTKISGVVFGSGLMELGLREFVSAQHINVEFAGFVSNPWTSLTVKDLVIIPSASEGDGLVVIEALSAGVPILLSDIPEFRHFGFPDKHYCQGVSDFAKRLNEFQDRFNLLRIDPLLAKSILSPRSISTIGDKWEYFLENLDLVKTQDTKRDLLAD